MDTKLSDLHIAKIATFLPKWKHVAGQLGVGSEIIKDIEVRYPNPEDQRSEALKKWVGQDGSQATYKKLRDVLCELDEKNAAEEVEKLKVEKLAEDLPTRGPLVSPAEQSCGDSTRPSPSKTQLSGEKHHIKDNCGCGKCDVQGLISNGCSNPLYQQFLHLDVGKLTKNEKDILILKIKEDADAINNEHRHMILEFKTWMKENVSVEDYRDILYNIPGTIRKKVPMLQDRWKEIKAADHTDCSVILSDYYTWFNCSILKIVLEDAKTLTHKDTTDILSTIQSYTDKVHKYCKRSIFECPPPSCMSLTKGTTYFSLKVLNYQVHDVKTFTAEEIQVFEATLMSSLNIQEYALKLCTVAEGCVELVYSVPLCIYSVLFPLNEEQWKLLITLGVTELMTKDYHYKQCNATPLLESLNGALALKYELKQVQVQKNISDMKPGDEDIKKLLAACQKQFATIVQHCSTLENVTVQELVDCVTKVPQKPLFYQSLRNFVQCATVEEFFYTLCSTYSDFIFYHLFEKVVETFGNEILKSDIKKYTEKLMSVTKVAKVAEFLQNGTIPTSTATEIVLEIKIPYLDCTISDIQGVRDEMRKISYLFEFCHTNHNVSGDSKTIMKWLFPQAYSRHLQVDILLGSIPFSTLFISKGIFSTSALVNCGVLKICVAGLSVFEYDPQDKAIKHLRIRSILQQKKQMDEESQLAHLQIPDDLSFKASNIMKVLKFSNEQWHEFGLVIGFSLQDIADCWSSQTSMSNYQNILLERWLSTENTASWYTVVMAVNAMLPPSCNFAEYIVKNYESLANITENELKNIEDIIPPSITTKNFIIHDFTIQTEEMDLDGVTLDVNKVVDKRFKSIQEVLRASNEELKKISKSKDYWKRQDELDEELIRAVSTHNVELKSILQRTEQLCWDIHSRDSELHTLIDQIEERCQTIHHMDANVHSKEQIFQELREQLFRLNELRSRNVEKVSALLKIPSKVSELLKEAENSRQLCTAAQKSLVITAIKQSTILHNTCSVLNKNQERLDDLANGMKNMLASWTAYFDRNLATVGLAATAGIATGVILGAAVGFATGGVGVPVVAGITSGIISAATVGTVTWLHYQKKGNQSLILFTKKANENKDLCLQFENLASSMKRPRIGIQVH